MTSRSGRTPNFNEEEKLLMAELGREFPKVEIKGYDNKTLRKKANPWEEMLQKFNSRNPNGIKWDMNMSFYIAFTAVEIIPTHKKS